MAAIFVVTSVIPYVFFFDKICVFFFLPHWCQYIWNCSTCLSMHITNANGVLGELQILYIWQHIFLSHLWSLKYFLLAGLFRFVNAYEIFSDIHIYFQNGHHIWSFTSMITYEFLVSRHVCFANAHEVSTHIQKHLAAILGSFTYMILFLVW